MGYHTDFFGEFVLDKPLESKHKLYLEKFNATRRMKRDENALSSIPDKIREDVALPVGKDGAYFVAGTGFAGQDKDSSIKDYNNPPSDQPGLWCQWVPNNDGTIIEWDGGEKFYNYVEWMKYIIVNFLEVWGYTLNGKVDYWGESPRDSGTMTVTNNKVTVKADNTTY